MGPDDIAIQVQLSVQRPLAGKPTEWPLRVRGTDVVGGIEGIPASIGVYQRFGRVGRYDVYAFVFFGRAHPTARQLARANSELRTGRLP